MKKQFCQKKIITVDDSQPIFAQTYIYSKILLLLTMHFYVYRIHSSKIRISTTLSIYFEYEKYNAT